jgi:hypothetical protein
MQKVVFKKKELLYWQLAGAVFVLLVGTLLHFTFAWSGYSRVVAVFSTVNESVWEHLKLGFWPFFLFSLVEYFFVNKDVADFFFAAFIGVAVIQLFIPLVFYTYTAFTGGPVLGVDITTFVVAVLLGYLVSYLLLQQRTQIPGVLNIIGFVLLLVNALAFIVFTFYPPHLPIFFDASAGQYGIVMPH